MRYLTTTAITVVCFCASAYGQGPPSQTPGPATKVAVVSSNVTHIGRRPQEHVTLGAASGTLDTCPTKGVGWFGFVRRTQDGSQESFFVVPAGKALILTDFGIGALKNDGWVVGDLITFQLGRVGDFIPFYQTGKTVDSATAAAARTWMTDHLISGVVFRAGQIPCSNTGLGLEPTGGHGTGLSFVSGYLVDE